MQELRKGKTGRILENLTQYYVAAASIAPHRVRNGIDPNGRIICGRLPVQTLQECRKRLAGRIAAKSWNRNSRGMAEQLPQSDPGLCSELAVWNPPAFQVLVHVRVEIEFSRIHEPQDRQRGDRFADRRGLEKRIWCNRGTTGPRNAKS